MEDITKTLLNLIITHGVADANHFMLFMNFRKVCTEAKSMVDVILEDKLPILLTKMPGEDCFTNLLNIYHERRKLIINEKKGTSLDGRIKHGYDMCRYSFLDNNEEEIMTIEMEGYYYKGLLHGPYIHREDAAWGEIEIFCHFNKGIMHGLTQISLYRDKGINERYVFDIENGILKGRYKQYSDLQVDIFEGCNISKSTITLQTIQDLKSFILDYWGLQNFQNRADVKDKYIIVNGKRVNGISYTGENTIFKFLDKKLSPLFRRRPIKSPLDGWDAKCSKFLETSHIKKNKIEDVYC